MSPKDQGRCFWGAAPNIFSPPREATPGLINLKLAEVTQLLWFYVTALLKSVKSKIFF